MTDERKEINPEEVARIKRQALQEFANDEWLHGRFDSDQRAKAFAAKRYPPPAPRKVRAELRVGRYGSTLFRWDADYFRISTDSGCKWGVLPRADVANLAAHIAALDARADADGMVEEGLGASTSARAEARDEGVGIAGLDTPQHGAASAPAPAPEEARVWWIHPPDVSGASHGPSMVCTSCIPVVPRASLDAMREERDQLQRACDEMFPAEMRLDLEHEVESLRAQLAAATEGIAAVERVVREHACPVVNSEDGESRYVCFNENADPIIEADTLADAVRGIVRCWNQMEERLAAATGPVSKEEFQNAVNAIIRVRNRVEAPTSLVIARAALAALNREVRE